MYNCIDCSSNDKMINCKYLCQSALFIISSNVELNSIELIIKGEIIFDAPDIITRSWR